MVAAGSETGGNRGPTDAFVARSTDLGETWEFSVIAASEEVEYTTRDGETLTEGERYGYVRMATHPTDPDLVYAGFRVQPAEAPFAQVPVRSVVSTSTDGGRTWSEPVDVMDQTFSRDEVYGSGAPSVAVAGDGTIYAFTKERPPPAPPPPTPAPPKPRCPPHQGPPRCASRLRPPPPPSLRKGRRRRSPKACPVPAPPPRPRRRPPPPPPPLPGPESRERDHAC